MKPAAMPWCLVACLLCFVVGLALGVVGHAWALVGAIDEAEGKARRHGYRLGYAEGAAAQRVAATEPRGARAAASSDMEAGTA